MAMVLCDPGVNFIFCSWVSLAHFCSFKVKFLFSFYFEPQRARGPYPVPSAHYTILTYINILIALMLALSGFRLGNRTKQTADGRLNPHVYTAVPHIVHGRAAIDRILCMCLCRMDVLRAIFG